MADKKLVVDLAKGTQEYVDLTPEEIAEREAQAEAFLAAKAEEEAQAAEKAARRAEVIAKLGLTEDDLAALL